MFSLRRSSGVGTPEIIKAHATTLVAVATLASFIIDITNAGRSPPAPLSECIAMHKPITTPDRLAPPPALTQEHSEYLDGFISTREAADMLGTTVASLSYGRSTGKYGPPYHLWGNRTVRYRRRDILEYMAQRRFAPTAA